MKKIYWLMENTIEVIRWKTVGSQRTGFARADNVW